MAKQTEKTAKKSETKGAKESKPSRSGMRSALLVAAPIVIAFVVFFVVVLPTLSVPFSTFKSTFLGAQRVSVVASYSDQSQAGSVLQCATQVVQVAAHSRNATTIDFYVLNGTRCTYPVGGLGHTVSLATNTIQNCINMTVGEPSIFLNYSVNNQTEITPYRLSIYGNAQYMAQCPVAVDLS